MTGQPLLVGVEMGVGSRGVVCGRVVRLHHRQVIVGVRTAMRARAFRVKEHVAWLRCTKSRVQGVEMLGCRVLLGSQVCKQEGWPLLPGSRCLAGGGWG